MDSIRKEDFIGHFSFEHVNFSYPNADMLALNDFSLEI